MRIMGTLLGTCYLIAFALLLLISWQHRFTFLFEYEVVSEGTGRQLMALLLSMLMLFVAMVVGHRYFTKRGIIILWLLVVLMAFLAWPFTNLDPAAYLVGASNWQLFGSNPMREAYSAVAQNPWLPLLKNVWWVDAPSPYGPAFFIPMRLLVLVSTNFVVVMYAYKLVIFVAYALIALMWLRFHSAEQAVNQKMMIIFLLNPVLLYFVVFEGHNDILMLLAMLGALLWQRQKKEIGSYFLLMVALLIKVPALIMWPVGWFKRGDFSLKRALVSSGGGITVLLAVWYIAGPTLSSFKEATLSLWGIGCLYVCSPLWASMIAIGIPPLLAGMVLWIVIAYRYLYEHFNPMKYALWSFTVLYMLATGWLSPWYLVVPLVFATFINEKKYEVIAIGITIYALGILLFVY